jgi:hypothetical protein
MDNSQDWIVHSRIQPSCLKHVILIYLNSSIFKQVLEKLFIIVGYCETVLFHQQSEWMPFVKGTIQIWCYLLKLKLHLKIIVCMYIMLSDPATGTFEKTLATVNRMLRHRCPVVLDC